MTLHVATDSTKNTSISFVPATAASSKLLTLQMLHSPKPNPTYNSLINLVTSLTEKLALIEQKVSATSSSSSSSSSSSTFPIPSLSTLLPESPSLPQSSPSTIFHPTQHLPTTLYTHPLTLSCSQ
eukprot:Phypoly_transcript_24336.p1 GENE.Phypoly_transcript_24336~~Phypoly_transcript_24336.p1  ORF type:complete len:132 (-),score=35.50 Phypoly_transcript_24336:156-530(-)